MRTDKILILIWLFALLCVTSAGAQSQTFYWFDNDSEHGVFLSQSISGEIDASKLTNGIHWLHCMASDTQGVLSSVKSACFYKNAELSQGAMHMFIDGKPKASNSITNGLGTVMIDLSSPDISYGLHSLGVYYVSRDGAMTCMIEDFFIKIPQSSDLDLMNGYFMFDGVKIVESGGPFTNGIMHTDLDVNRIADGLHTISFILTGSHGITANSLSRLFIKTPMEGDMLTGYSYWVNDNFEDIAETKLDPPSRVCSVVCLLDLPTYPFRSAEFSLAKGDDGKLNAFSVNNLNFLFAKNGTGFILQSAPYVDVNSYREVSPIKYLSPGMKEKVGVIGRDEIKWYQVKAEYGDSLVFSLDRAATINVFSSDGTLLLKSQGSNSIVKHGCRAPGNDKLLVAVHDQQSDNRRGVELLYEKIDRYTLISHTPTSSANVGLINMDLYGNGFEDLKGAAIVKDGETFECDSLVVRSGGYAIAQFNLMSQRMLPIGEYDLQLAFDTDIDDKRTFTAARALKLEHPDFSPIKTELDYNVFKDGVNPHKIRVNITNTGNVGSALIPLNIAVCSPYVVGLRFENFDVGYVSQFGMDSIPLSVTVDNLAGMGLSGNFMPLVLPYLGPRETKTIELSVLFEDDSWGLDKWHFYAWPGQPLSYTAHETAASRPYRSGIKLDPAVNFSDNYCDGENNVDIQDVSDILDNTNIPKSRWQKFMVKLSLAIGEVFAGITIGTSKIRDEIYVENGTVPLGKDISDYNWKYRQERFRSPGEISMDLAMTFAPDRLKPSYELYRDMQEQGGRDCPQPSGYSLNHIPLSWDPNDIIGFTHESGSLFIGRNDKELEYIIEFENDSTMATMPANAVVLRSQFDKKIFDLSGFRPGKIRFGKFNIEAGEEAEFTKTIDLRPSTNALAEINHTLNYDTGESVWTIRAIDPLTLEPIVGEMYGLLPVNNADGDGQGCVSYKIPLLDSLTDGTTVSNSASITFDSNPPIVTPEWMNVTDYIDPASCITEAENDGDNRLHIKWQGSDNRAGVWKYTLYRRIGEDGLWECVGNDLTETEIWLPVEQGVEYGFFVVATDKAGNREEKEWLPEMTYKDKVITVSVEVIRPDDKIDESIYDLLGRKVVDPSPGIYVRGGRKVLILK